MKRLAALLLAASTLCVAATPSEITSEYRLTSSGLTIGRVKESFLRKGDTYTIQSVTNSEGMLKLFVNDQIMLSSSGRIVAGGLQPLAFGQRWSKDASRDIEATFDWDHGIMHSLAEGKPSEVPLPRQTQDRLSVMYQFMNLGRGEGVVEMPMSNGRKIETYTYRYVGDERLATPAGEFDTLHYERVVSGPGESRAELWLAKDRFNLPVKIVFRDPRGLRVVQDIVALQAR